MALFLTNRFGQCGERPDQFDLHFDDRELQRRAQQPEQGALGRSREDEEEEGKGREEEGEEEQEGEGEEALEEARSPVSAQVQEDAAQQDGEHLLLRRPERDSRRLSQRGRFCLVACLKQTLPLAVVALHVKPTAVWIALEAK